MVRERRTGCRDNQRRKDHGLHSPAPYFAGIVRLIRALPSGSTEFRLFSSQMYSAIVQSRCRFNVLVVTYGAVSASGSAIVVSMVIVSGSVSRNRSTIFIRLPC